MAMLAERPGQVLVGQPVHHGVPARPTGRRADQATSARTARRTSGCPPRAPRRPRPAPAPRAARAAAVRPAEPAALDCDSARYTTTVLASPALTAAAACATTAPSASPPSGEGREERQLRYAEPAYQLRLADRLERRGEPAQPVDLGRARRPRRRHAPSTASIARSQAVPGSALPYRSARSRRSLPSRPITASPRRARSGEPRARRRPRRASPASTSTGVLARLRRCDHPDRRPGHPHRVAREGHRTLAGIFDGDEIPRSRKSPSARPPTWNGARPPAPPPRRARASRPSCPRWRSTRAPPRRLSLVLAPARHGREPRVGEQVLAAHQPGHPLPLPVAAAVDAHVVTRPERRAGIDVGRRGGEEERRPVAEPGGVHVPLDRPAEVNPHEGRAPGRSSRPAPAGRARPFPAGTARRVSPPRAPCRCRCRPRRGLASSAGRPAPR